MRRYLEQPSLRMFVCCVVLLIVCAPRPLRADTSSEKKRALMATIKRIAIISPFFATETLTKGETGRKTASGEGNQTGPTTAGDARLAEYAAQLRKLAEHVCTRLPVRVAARTPFTIVPAEEVATALKALEWTPEKLFQNGGRMRGTRYPLPDPEAVKKLAARLHADAVLLTALDEPRRKNGRVVYNFLLGMDYRNSQVEARGGFYVLMADGTVALTEDIDVAHPLTHLGNHEYLLVDWTEAQDVMIEDMLDDWNRYTPAK